MRSLAVVSLLAATSSSTCGGGGGGSDAGTDAGTGLPPGPPNVLLVVDRSGSMAKPVDPGSASCQTTVAGCPVCGLGGCPACPAGCSTRLSDLQTALHQVLSGGACLPYRLGVTAFPKPSGGSCDPSTTADVLVELPARGAPYDGAAQARAIDLAVQGLVAGGGTPTAGTLAALEGEASLEDPSHPGVVVLLTDGEPNCNPNNPHDCTQAACGCTFFQGLAPAPGTCPGAGCGCGQAAGGPSCQLGCLDEDASVASIRALGQLGIRVAVVGFGSETGPDGGGTGLAPSALNAMAQAGGLARSCSVDADCGTGDVCDIASGRCGRAYYQAADAAELLARMGDVCTAIGAVVGH